MNQYKYQNDEVTGVCIEWINWNKKIACRFSEKIMIVIFPVLIKAVVFHNVGLSWLI